MKGDPAANPPGSAASSPSSREGTTGRLRRSEARALTRRRLLEMAAVVFAERGFRATAIEEVAERAGYSIGAVYSNFTGKDDLFLNLMRERLEGLEDGLRRWSSQQPRTALAPQDRAVALEAELDQMARGEEATPAGWWRLLAEFRAYAETNVDVRRELLESEARCRGIIASDIERIATTYGLDTGMSPNDMADISIAILDGFRAAHAQGRLAMTPAQAYRRVVAMMIESSNPGAQLGSLRSRVASPK
jgi:AcrR family transcriptional regulator